MQSCGVRRPSVCLSVRPSIVSVNILRKSLLLPDKWLDRDQTCAHHGPRRACIQDVLKVKVEVKDHMIRTLLWFHENRFFSRANGWIATKLTHDGLYCLRRGCAEPQGRSQTSRDTGTYMISQKSLLLPGKWLHPDQTQSFANLLPFVRSVFFCIPIPKWLSF